ncbi:MAG: hypothetical protein JJU02_14640 [Cryomorphaceae bacterium]|nr:hypothetical protein [Cryomorphaceae bacterium]
MISIKIEGIFEPEQVRIQKFTDKEDFGRKGPFGADSIFYRNPNEKEHLTNLKMLKWILPPLSGRAFANPFNKYINPH